MTVPAAPRRTTLALLSAGVLAGCGGSDARERPTTTTAARAAWTNSAASICREVRRASRGLAATVAREVDGDVTRRTLELARRQQQLDTRRLAALEELPRDAAERPRVARLLALLERADATVGPLADVLVSGDREDFLVVHRRLRALSGPVGRAAGALRVPGCVPDQVAADRLRS